MIRDARLDVLDHLADLLEQPRPVDGDYRELSLRLLEEDNRNRATDPAYRARYYRVLVDCELHGTQPAGEIASYLCMDEIIVGLLNLQRRATTDNEETTING